MDELPMHSCGHRLHKSIRSDDILICRVCMVDVPKDNKKKIGGRKDGNKE